MRADYAAQKKKYEEQGKEIQESAKRSEEAAESDEHRALRYDIGEGLLEIGLCSARCTSSRKSDVPRHGRDRRGDRGNRRDHWAD